MRKMLLRNSQHLGELRLRHALAFSEGWPASPSRIPICPLDTRVQRPRRGLACFSALWARARSSHGTRALPPRQARYEPAS